MRNPIPRFIPRWISSSSYLPQWYLSQWHGNSLQKWSCWEYSCLSKERKFENAVLQTKVFGPQNGFNHFHVLLFPCSCSKHVPKFIVKMVFFFFFALSSSYACMKASNFTVHLNSECIWNLKDLQFASGCCLNKNNPLGKLQTSMWC